MIRECDLQLAWLALPAYKPCLLGCFSKSTRYCLCRSSTGGCDYGMRGFVDYDYAELMVTEETMPCRRLFLHQAVCAVSYQNARGHLREGISVNAGDYEVASDFEKKPDVQRWIKTML